MSTDLANDRLALALFRQLLESEPIHPTTVEDVLKDSAPDVAARVRRMLDRHLSDTQRLEKVWHDAPLEPTFPSRLGPFDIVRPLGRGGMGMVVLGRRQSSDFTQNVAIKLIPGWMLDASQRARFLFEREVVARLRHPHIAHLIDGGNGPSGELWYAMELVEGNTLIRYCDERKMPLRERLLLLLDLCDALSHAHRSLIVHRDIKPGNVMVTSDGQVKLIDFGIAKSLDSAASTHTREAAPMTPQYASPEQLRHERITTASDIWQLAALAYELLIGVTARTDTAAIIERPSLRAATIDDAVAVTRRTSPAALAAQLRGDIDSILQKALRDDPQERYDSVAAFAADLRAYLAGRPVSARQGEQWYALRRAVAKHRWAVGFAAAAAVALVSGTVVSVLFAHRASEEAQLATDTSELLSKVLLARDSGASPTMNLSEYFTHAIDTIRRDTSLPPARRYGLLNEVMMRGVEVGAKDAILRAGPEMVRLAGQSFPAGDHRQAEALTMHALALAIQGAQNAGQVNSLLAQSEAIVAKLPRREADGQMLLVYMARLFLANAAGDSDALITYSRHNAELARTSTTLSAQSRLNARMSLVNALENTQQVDEALREIDSLLADLPEYARTDHILEGTQEWVRTTGCQMRSRVKVADALQDCSRQVGELEKAGRIDTMNGYYALLGLGRSLAKSDRSAEAVDAYRRAEQSLVAVQGANATSGQMANVKRMLGTRLYALKRFDEAEIAQRRALDIVALSFAATHPGRLGIQLELAESIAAQDKKDALAPLLLADEVVAGLDAASQARWKTLHALVNTSKKTP
ncbi:serine/threonine-protein kinase [Tahibacter amnicola]|uniref:Serine/threonine protein kinase n=1 Tax=Tahibacter amnicola TaxID=2976241 RepID=A0ABY6BCN6_9GAMM|nr:serine/threonine-protein kinase [Tahibacter amnicola]UXI67336.1 serine/threonine protein kinase [Tahibacter amnicola]